MIVNEPSARKQDNGRIDLTWYYGDLFRLQPIALSDQFDCLFLSLYEEIRDLYA